MSGGFPVRCFTCGKVLGNLYDTYIEKCESGRDSAVVLDELKLGRSCCRRMLSTHVDVLKYQLLYPVYENGVQRLGVLNYDDDDADGEETDEDHVEGDEDHDEEEEGEGEGDLDEEEEEEEEGEEEEGDEEDEDQMIVSIPDEHLDDIKARIGRFIKTQTITKTRSCITVRTNGLDWSYQCAVKLMGEYDDPDIAAHIHQIWRAGLFPIEIMIKSCNFFFAIPRDAIFEGNINLYPLLSADAEIPSIADFI